MDPAGFLRATPPFDALPRPLFDEAAAALTEVRVPAGTWLTRAGGEPLAHLHVIRRGAVRLERHGQTLEVVEEGELFGYTSLITHAATLDVAVEEDLLAYRLPADVFRRLLSDPGFAGHFAAGLGERLRSSLEHSPVAAFQPDLSAPVGTLVRAPPAWVDAGATVREAARLMRRAGVSALLVRGHPPGILTDPDFRDRVVAEGLGGDAAVGEVASRPLWTVPWETPVYQAWMELLDAGYHHLPVVRDGEVVGVVTSADLMRSSAQGPMAVLRRVERLASRDALAGYAAQVAEMTSALLAARLDPVVIAGLVARQNDALLRPLLRFAETELGSPPAPFAWMAFGSEGRMEQTLLTDQDNALAFADEGAGGAGWYQAFAERVGGDLEAAGFPRCPGGYMARAWNAPVSEWAARFASWIDRPAPKALLDAATFYDFRRVAGRLDLAPLQETVARAAQHPVFLRAMAEEALRFRPPPLLLLRVRGESSTVDLKKQGLSPIVFLARCYALELGAPERNTLERLDAAERAGLMSPEVRSNVAEAYRFLLGLRMRLQLRALVAGRTPSNEVALSDLTPVERTRLKESFRAVKSWQEMAAYHWRV
ncbi:MAG TPA: putative nucleotidyltransferase substrate binding domain-containing protein [Anaeromyxobacteraceae bacterium]|nr:putative nucleotidyltransferase substrate binding domain-containing protein [Anaeromyxobacteraceae bacterium]